MEAVGAWHQGGAVVLWEDGHGDLVDPDGVAVAVDINELNFNLNYFISHHF